MTYVSHKNIRKLILTKIYYYSTKIFNYINLYVHESEVRGQVSCSGYAVMFFTRNRIHLFLEFWLKDTYYEVVLVMFFTRNRTHLFLEFW